jgi:hypothetical protein
MAACITLDTKLSQVLNTHKCTSNHEKTMMQRLEEPRTDREPASCSNAPSQHADRGKNHQTCSSAITATKEIHQYEECAPAIAALSLAMRWKAPFNIEM